MPGFVKLNIVLSLSLLVVGGHSFTVAAQQAKPPSEETRKILPGKDSPPTNQTLVKVSTIQELRTALRDPQPGTTVLIAPGSYSGGFYLGNVHGTPESPIVIAAEVAAIPPEFSGSGEGIKLSSCSYVKLSSLMLTGFGSNGINIDDGGKSDRPSHHILLEKLVIADTGPQGNNDALKMSGVQHFVVRDCRFDGWGGSGIDLVGCQHGVIERSQFIGHEGYRNKNAVQIKGGSSSILVQTSFFQDAGERIINIGGATGLDFFRPPDATYEAKDIIVAGNRFVGGEAHIAWVTCRYSHVHHNIFYLPEKWLGRILQESKDARFKPCQIGLFEHNLIVTDDRVRTHVNAGGGTDPSTFTFRANAWYQPNGKSSPSLPTREIDGIRDVDPKLEHAGTAEMAITAVAPELASIGPGAYEPWAAPADFTDIELPAAAWVPPPKPSALPRILRTSAIFAFVVAAAVIVFRWAKSLGWSGLSQLCADFVNPNRGKR